MILNFLLLKNMAKNKDYREGKSEYILGGILGLMIVVFILCVYQNKG